MNFNKNGLYPLFLSSFFFFMYLLNKMNFFPALPLSEMAFVITVDASSHI